MKDEYDFSKAKRGALVQQKNKTRITMYIDNTVLDVFRTKADEAGRGYQTMINDVLKEYIEKSSAQSLENTLRKLIREELQRDKHETIMKYLGTATSSDWSSNLGDSLSDNAPSETFDFNKRPMTGN